MIELPTRILLCGVSRSGKSTLGDSLNARFGYQVSAFAEPLKQAAKVIFGFDEEHLYGPSETREVPYPRFKFSGHCFECHEECINLGSAGWYCPTCCAKYPRHITPRLALQTLGTAWGRRLCPDIWAEACFAAMRPDRAYVVTDCRFSNERVAGRDHGGCVVLLQRGLEESHSPHPSEKEVRDAAAIPELFDVVLDNREGSPRENFGKLVDALCQLDHNRRSVMKMRAFEDREETR